jgi:3-oxoacyl-[acyl-carrier protein] reductase
MDLRLADRVALVAGSSRGIGKAIAAAFLAEGCRTVITGRDTAALEAARVELAKQHGDGRLLACPGDLSQTEVIRDTLGRVRGHWGRIDAVVANIGSGRGTPGWQPPADDWIRLSEINLYASARLVSEVLPDLIESRAGSLVLIASITGVESTPAPLPYSAAKAALINYAKNVSRLVGKNQVRINCVAPGNILFPGGSWERHLEQRHDEVMNYIQTEVPLQRFGTPEEIADLVVFLSSDRASFITGACIIADGGQTRGI